MYETINEKVDVIAIFGQGFQDAKPFKIRWHGQDHIITKVGYKHKMREGQKIIHIFSCTDGATFFELRFDAEDLKWLIGRVWDGEAQ
jgi:hypothetical protein